MKKSSSPYKLGQRFTRRCVGPAAVRVGVRFALRAHICRLVPASNVNWLADVRPMVAFTLYARR
jgi:hypothetical protein